MGEEYSRSTVERYVRIIEGRPSADDIKNVPSIIKEKLEEAGQDPNSWSMAWIKDKNTSIRINNIQQMPTRDEIERVIREAVSNAVIKHPIGAPTYTNSAALRGVISDAHVGMDSNVEGSVFGFEYNAEVFNKNLDRFFEAIQKEIAFHGSFDTIFIDDLGDGLDGYDAMTTRGGHKLQQNMGNNAQWKTYVDGKLSTLINIINLNGAANYEFRNVTNDNHGGSFAWTANMAIKMALELMFPNVKYHVLGKAIEHFVYGEHCHIITHGKDKQFMMKGMPLHLTKDVFKLVSEYIDFHEIRSKYIHLDKGDLHQTGYERSSKFDYRNFMSFAPPSPWVQANFGLGYCGFSTQIIPKATNEIKHTDIFFELKKKK
jgi:hypothetical protein